jgi:HD-GYP domain-containing protein (c-di-GMP phosphodiesterase class II)
MESYDAVRRLITAMSILHEEHDHHGQHAADLARALAVACDLPAPLVALYEIGAHLHDIGKLLIDKELVTAPRKLTPDEMNQVQLHAPLGWAAVDQAGFEPEICDIVRHHHERYDGNGYPDQLQQEEISLGARIVRITDSYSALISDRSYRPAYSPAFARSFIEAGRSTEFDPHLVDLFFARVIET